MKREDVISVTRDELELLYGQANYIYNVKIEEQEIGTLKALAEAFGEKPGK